MAEVDNSLRQSERVHKMLSSEWVVLFYVSLGRCIDGNNTFTCTCDPGFVGRTCNIDFDDCSSSPCIHGTKNNTLLCYNNNNNKTSKITGKKRERERERKKKKSLYSTFVSKNPKRKSSGSQGAFQIYMLFGYIPSRDRICHLSLHQGSTERKIQRIKPSIGSLYSNRTNYHFSFSWFFVAPTYGIQQQSPDSLWRKASAGASIS